MIAEMTNMEAILLAFGGALLLTAIGNLAAMWRTQAVLKNEVHHLKADIEEIKADVKRLLERWGT